MKCEERRWKDGRPCQHEAKYLVSWNCMAVCGVHNRGYLRGIPIVELAGKWATRHGSNESD